MSSGPATSSRMPDADVRERVVERVSESFIVQAPAGSGKTELLTQRFLALLATQEEPESVLAITFTRKAASEMRIRILESLDSALRDLRADELEKMDLHKMRRRELAQAVLQADKKFGWGLLENPMRLQIRTVDSLSDSIARKLPILAGISADLAVTEDPYDLYREAADRTLAEIGGSNRESAAVATLLRYRDNKVSDVSELLVSMLAKRDQWLRIITGANTASEEELEELRLELEGALRRAVEEDLRKVKVGLTSIFGRGDAGELVRLARINAGMAAGKNETPAASAQELVVWRAIAELTLTKDGSFRKRIAKGLEDADDKNSCKVLLEAFGKRAEDIEKLCALLTKIRKLPTPAYSDDEWRFVRALLVALPRCAAHLKIVFAENAKVDFIEMAWAAKAALESEEGPTELGLAMGSKLKHLLVDEFQDTSQSQLGLVNALTRTWEEGGGNTLFLVGDPMQSIYAFREAEVTIFTRAFRTESDSVRDLRWNVSPLRLTANFRSQRGLVEWFNRTHSEILTRDDDATSAVKYSSAQAIQEQARNAVVIRGFSAKDYRSEAAYVAEQVESCLKENDEQRIAILVRARAHLAYIVRELESKGIAFRAVNIDELATRQTVLDLDALARAILDPADRTAWLAVLRSPVCGLTLSDLWELCRGDRDSTIPSLLRVRGERLSEDGRRRAARVLEVIEEAETSWTTQRFRIVLERAWTSLGGPATFKESEVAADARDAKAYLEFLEDRWQLGVRPGTRQFDSKLNELYAPAATDPDIRVELQTIHGAKGLEWDIVFLPALGRVPRNEDKQMLYWREQRFNGKEELLLGPMRSVKVPEPEKTIENFLQNISKERAKEERKRLLYVATTRAKKRLYLTANLNADGTAASNSLLGLMWPVEEVAAAFGDSVGEIKETAKQESASLSQMPLRRLRAGYVVPSSPEPLLIKGSIGDDREDQTLHTFDWAGETRRRIGTVTHAFLQAIGREGVERWSETRVKSARAAISTALMTEGVGPERIEAAVGEVTAALIYSILDERGRWILEKKGEDSSELAVTAMVEGAPKRLKIDRTFVEGNLRWVIDFKTTQIEGGDSEKYFTDQVEKYREDLMQYAKALRLLDPNREIRGALYFPLQRELRVVPLELLA